MSGPKENKPYERPSLSLGAMYNRPNLDITIRLQMPLEYATNGSI